MTTNFVQRGTEFIRQAVEKDNEEKWDEALALYTQGISHLMTGLKYEKNQRIVATVKEKVTKYMQRAEEIKLSLENPQPKKKKQKARAGGGGRSGGNGGGDGKEADDDSDVDEDTAKLQGALSSAIVMERPNVAWDDVAGLEVAKGLLKEAVILPIRFPHLFTEGRKPWKGILLFGPPGTGKSYLAKAVATEANNSTFFSVSSSDLVSKYVGESERLVRNLFEMARERAPAIIFIDEIDSLAGKRSDGEQDNTRRIKTEFLVQMQGVGNDMDGVLVLGATNCPWDLDPAIRRRFQKRIYIPLPDFEGRRAMFQIHTKKTDNCLSEQDIDELATMTDGFSGSDIGGVVQDALMEPVRTLQIATHFAQRPNPADPNDYVLIPTTVPHGSRPPPGVRELTLMDIPEAEQNKVRAEQLGLSHFLRILESCKPSVGPEDLVRQEEWTQEFGQEG